MTTNPHVAALERAARVINPGGWAVESERPIATLLGSCVAACLWDPVLKIGGVNHFMLPGGGTGSSSQMDVLLRGDACMEALMNGMLARGSRKNRMQSKLFGGGNVLSSLSGVNVGERNAEFARHWLEQEGVPVVAADLLGPWSRKLIFDPRSGDVFCRRGSTDSSLAEAEARYRKTLEAQKKTNVELF